MLFDELPDVKTFFKGRGCLLLSPHRLVIAAEEANVAENFQKRWLQCFGYDFHRTSKRADVFLVKTWWFLDIRKLSSQAPDFLLGAGTEILSLERDFSRDLVPVNPSAVGRH